MCVFDSTCIRFFRLPCSQRTPVTMDSLDCFIALPWLFPLLLPPLPPPGSLYLSQGLLKTCVSAYVWVFMDENEEVNS